MPVFLWALLQLPRFCFHSSPCRFYVVVSCKTVLKLFWVDWCCSHTYSCAHADTKPRTPQAPSLAIPKAIRPGSDLRRSRKSGHGLVCGGPAQFAQASRGAPVGRRRGQALHQHHSSQQRSGVRSSRESGQLMPSTSKLKAGVRRPWQSARELHNLHSEPSSEEVGADMIRRSPHRVLTSPRTGGHSMHSIHT